MWISLWLSRQEAREEVWNVQRPRPERLWLWERNRMVDDRKQPVERRFACNIGDERE